MSLRTSLGIVVLANLAFAAWALLIDRPVMAPAARDISHLPKLVLAGDTAATTPVVVAARDTTRAPAAVSAATAGHCVTVGPFSDLATAAAASSLLESRGFTPTQRDEPGQDVIAYWVSLDNVASEAAATRVLQKLRSNGVTDARVMPIASASDALRVSVGLFNERTGAERRARQVRSLGLTPAISEQHQLQAAYWVNISLTSPEQSVSTQGLLPSAAAGAHLEIRDCPSPPGSAPASAPVPTSPK